MRSTKGVRQILVLGAGLDTFAYRLERTQELRVFELDHPATQAEKRRRLTEAQIAEPAHVSYVAHDFEGGSMTAALKAAGLDPDRGAFVLWLGVTPYLTEEAVFATLGELAQLAGRGGSRVRLHQPAGGGRRTQRAQLPSRDGGAGRGERRAVPVLFQFGCASRSRARAGVLRHRGSRSSGARCALSARLAGRSSARAGRTRCADGDELTAAIFPALRRSRNALLPQPIILGLVDRGRSRIAEIVEMHAVGLARAPGCERRNDRDAKGDARRQSAAHSSNRAARLWRTKRARTPSAWCRCSGRSPCRRRGRASETVPDRNSERPRYSPGRQRPTSGSRRGRRAERS